MGVNLFRYKMVAFAVSSFYAGCCGALLYVVPGYFVPNSSFNLEVSVLFIAMLLVGGVGTISGAILGAFFFIYLPIATRMMPEFVPGLSSNAAQTPNVYQVEGVLQVARQGLVGGARLACAGWVVVREDDRGGVVLQCELDHLSRIDGRLREGAAEQFDGRKQAVAGVEQQHHEHFVRQCADLQAQPVAHRSRRIEQVALEHLLRQRTPRQFHDCLQLGILGRSHARDGREFGCGSGAQPGQRAEACDQFARQIDRAHAAYADAQEDRQQFGVGQRACAACEQSFARTFVLGPVGDRHGAAPV